MGERHLCGRVPERGSGQAPCHSEESSMRIAAAKSHWAQVGLRASRPVQPQPPCALPFTARPFIGGAVLLAEVAATAAACSGNVPSTSVMETRLRRGSICGGCGSMSFVVTTSGRSRGARMRPVGRSVPERRAVQGRRHHDPHHPSSRSRSALLRRIPAIAVSVRQAGLVEHAPGGLGTSASTSRPAARVRSGSRLPCCAPGRTAGSPPRRPRARERGRC